MKRNIPLILLLIITCSFTGYMFYLNQQSRKADDVQAVPNITRAILKIGVILPLSGDAASGGLPLKQAAEIAVEEINAEKNKTFPRMELVFQDGRCEKSSAESAANQLINKDNVGFLIGGACSDEFLIAAPIAQKKNILSFTPSATSPQISTLGKNVFRTTPSDVFAGKAAAQYAFTKMNAKSAAIIAEDKDFTNALKNVFKAEFTKQGGQITKEYIFKTGTSDFAAITTEIQKNRPDVVYVIPQSPSPGLLAIKEIKDRNIRTNILTGEILLQRETISEQGKILEGITGIELFYDESNPKTQHLLTKYKSTYGVDAPYPAYMTGMYDIFYLINEAYINSDGSTEEMAKYLYKLRKWPGSVGDLSFNENGDPILAYSVRKIKDKKAIQIETYKPE